MRPPSYRAALVFMSALRVESQHWGGKAIDVVCVGEQFETQGTERAAYMAFTLGVRDEVAAWEIAVLLLRHAVVGPSQQEVGALIIGQ